MHNVSHVLILVYFQSLYRPAEWDWYQCFSFFCSCVVVLLCCCMSLCIRYLFQFDDDGVARWSWHKNFFLYPVVWRSRCGSSFLYEKFYFCSSNVIFFIFTVLLSVSVYRRWAVEWRWNDDEDVTCKQVNVLNMFNVIICFHIFICNAQYLRCVVGRSVSSLWQCQLAKLLLNMYSTNE